MLTKLCLGFCASFLAVRSFNYILNKAKDYFRLRYIRSHNEAFRSLVQDVNNMADLFEDNDLDRTSSYNPGTYLKEAILYRAAQYQRPAWTIDAARCAVIRHLYRTNHPTITFDHFIDHYYGDDHLYVLPNDPLSSLKKVIYKLEDIQFSLENYYLRVKDLLITGWRTIANFILAYLVTKTLIALDEITTHKIKDIINHNIDVKPIKLILTAILSVTLFYLIIRWIKELAELIAE